MLFDPQTSGGLLIGVSEERVADLLEKLEGGTVIGRVVARGDGEARIDLVE